MITLEQYIALNIGEFKVKKLPDGTSTVEITNYDLEKYFDVTKYKERIPEGFDWILDYIILKPIKKLGNDLLKNVLIIPFFKTPIELKPLKTDLDVKEDETFRIYPIDPYLLIGNKGSYININKTIQQRSTAKNIELKVTSEIKEKDMVIDTKGKNIYPSKADPNKPLYPTLFYTNLPLTSKLHRIIAITWIAEPETDLVVNYIVDHKNNNKLDNRIENLQWVSQKDNKRKDNYNTISLKDFNYILKRLKDGGVVDFKTLEEIREFLKLDEKEAEKLKDDNLPVFLDVKGDIYAVYKKDQIITVDNKFLLDNTKYRYKIIDLKNGKVYLFKKLEEIYNAFNISEYKVTKGYKIRALDGLKDYFKSKNMTLEFLGDIDFYYTQSLKTKYKIVAKNLKTGEIVEELTTKKMADRLGVSKSAVISRLNGNPNEGLPLLTPSGEEWLIKRSDKDFPKLREPKIGKRLPVIIVDDNGKELHRFKSFREAENKLEKIKRDKLASLSKVIDNKYVVQFKDIAGYLS